VRPPLERRPRRRQGELGRDRPLDMLENPGDDERTVNARDDLDGPAAALADGHFDFEHAGQALRPGQAELVRIGFIRATSN
jgi:hypothetical protein